MFSELSIPHFTRTLDERGGDERKGRDVRFLAIVTSAGPRLVFDVLYGPFKRHHLFFFFALSPASCGPYLYL